MEHSQAEVVFLASRWGTLFGGIDALNSELCRAVRRAGHPVACVVEDAKTAAIDAAAREGVRLIPIPYLGMSGPTAKEAVRAHFIAPRAWVGHDVVTGPLANLLGSDEQPSVILHHMDYEDYAGARHPNKVVIDRGRAQQSVLRGASAVVAVGPRLRESAERIVGARRLYQLIPGFPDRVPRPRSTRDAFHVLMTGRLGADDDPVKQAQALAAGFGRAQLESKGAATWRLQLLGLPDDVVTASQAEASLRRQLPWDCWTNILVEGFTEDREALFDHLEAADVLVMPSLREGFGLAAWEAIGMGLPVILSQATGVYRVLQENLLDNLVRSLGILGLPRELDAPSPNAEDVKRLASALMDAEAERSMDVRKAAELMARARDRFRWSSAAEVILQAAGIQAKETRIPDLGSDGLPIAEDHRFVGRQADLAELDDAWLRGGVHVVHGMAGIGKSELVRRWIRRLIRSTDIPDTTCVISIGGQQGQEHSAATLTPERIAAGLGIPAYPDEKPDAVRARILARVRARKCLLVIDGFEVLQDPAKGQHPIKVPSVRQFLVDLASTSSLLLITGRNRLAPADCAEVLLYGHCTGRTLTGVSDKHGGMLLGELGMEGTAAELCQLARDLDGHPLSLVVAAVAAIRSGVSAGRFLSTLDARDCRAATSASQRLDRMLIWYEDVLSIQNPAMVSILYAFGLMNDPVTVSDLGLALSVILGGAEHDLTGLISDLRREQLVTTSDCFAGERLFDCHPMVRAHFGESLRSRDARRFEDAHSLMHEMFWGRTRQARREAGSPMLDQRETRDAYLAVRHAALAGDPVKAFKTWKQFFHGGELGLQPLTSDYGADLAAVAAILRAPGELDPVARGDLLNNKAFAERGLGMLGEAARTMRSSVEVALSQGDWTEAMLRLGNIADILAATGDFAGATRSINEARHLLDRNSTQHERWMLVAPVEMKLKHDIGDDAAAERLMHEYLVHPIDPMRLSPLGWFRIASILIDLDRPRDAAEIRDLLPLSKDYGHQPIHAVLSSILDVRLKDGRLDGEESERLLRHVRLVGTPEFVTRAHLAIAARLLVNNRPASRRHALNALDLAAQSGLRPLQLEAEHLMLLADDEQNGDLKAEALARRAVSANCHRLSRMISARSLR